MKGQGACGHRQVREDRILPFVLRTLGEEMKQDPGYAETIKALARAGMSFMALPPRWGTEKARPCRPGGDRGGRAGVCRRGGLLLGRDGPALVYSTGISLLIMPRSIPWRLRTIRAPT